MNIKLDKKNVLRYLGHKSQNVDRTLDSMIGLTMERIVKEIKPRYVYRDYAVTRENGEVGLCGTPLRGNDIARHLAESEHCVILAATLGTEADREIRSLQHTDMTLALIYDACANEYIEKVCDHAQSEISQDGSLGGLLGLCRFSPGYGDFSIGHQGLLLKLVDAERTIGLTQTDSHMLAPQKSVTAVIALRPEAGGYMAAQPKRCEICGMKGACSFRRQ